MSAESTTAFIKETTSNIEYFRKEHEITYAELVGALEIIKEGVFEEMRSQCRGEE